MNTSLLSAKGLVKRFQSPNPLEILSGIDLDVQKGESVAIMGRSGEGKSTLLHILGTLEAMDEGKIEIAGLPANKQTRDQIRSHHIGFVFQSFHLLEDFSVLENVLMPAQIARKSNSEEHGKRLLEKVGLLDRAGQRVKSLSGGEKQRVAIARALCNNPDLLLADEPTGNLDRKTADQIRELIFDSVKDGNRSLIMVTHEQVMADLCDRSYELKEGKLKQI